MSDSPPAFVDHLTAICVRFTPLVVRWAIGLLAGLSTVGCASTARDLGAAAAPAAVRAGLVEANSPDSQRQLQSLIASRSFQNAGHSIGEGVGAGLFQEANKLAGLTPAGQSGAATQPATLPDGRLANPASPGAAAVGAATGLNGIVQSGVQQAFLVAYDPQFREAQRALAETLGEGVAQGLINVFDKESPRLGRSLQAQLGPTFHTILHDQIAPALMDTLENQVAPVALKVWKQGAVETLKLSVQPDVAADVTTNAENASVGASRGTTQGLIAAGVLSPGGGLTADVRFVVYTVLVALAVIGVALFCLLVLLNLLALRHLLRRRPGASES